MWQVTRPSIARENTNMSDELSRSIASGVSQAVQRAVDEALSRLPSQGVTSASSSSTSSSTSTTTSSSNSNSQDVRTCVGRQTVIVFVWNLVCYLILNIWPFSFFLSYCSVWCWFLWIACCSSSSIKVEFGTEIPRLLHIVFSHRCVTLLVVSSTTWNETWQLVITNFRLIGDHQQSHAMVRKYNV